MAKVIIDGFKDLETACKWVSAYEGGVEQDMSVWAEEHEFPCMVDMDSIVEDGYKETVTFKVE